MERIIKVAWGGLMINLDGSQFSPRDISRAQKGQALTISPDFKKGDKTVIVTRPNGDQEVWTRLAGKFSPHA